MMRILGFEIRRAKKEDYRRSKDFEKVTIAMYENLKEAIEFFENIDLEDTDCLSSVFIYVNTIRNYCTLYEDNKFSRPIATVKLISEANDLAVYCKNLQTMIIKYAESKDLIENKIKRSEDNDENNEYAYDAEELLRKMFTQMDVQRRIVIKTLVEIFVCIQYDVFRILLGVDITSSHYELNRRFPKGKTKYLFEIVEENRPQSKEE
jgi:hypothetical protein